MLQLVCKLVVPDDVITPNLIFVSGIAVVVITPTLFVASVFTNVAVTFVVGVVIDVGDDTEVAVINLSDGIGVLLGDVAALTMVEAVGENNVAITSTKVINSEIVVDAAP